MLRTTCSVTHVAPGWVEPNEKLTNKKAPFDNYLLRNYSAGMVRLCKVSRCACTPVAPRQLLSYPFDMASSENSIAMHVQTLSVGLPRVLRSTPREVISGIDKTPVQQRVSVTAAGIAGDGQADLSVHGDENKAVYAYAAEHYDYWQEQLGRELRSAQFGENLTVSGLLEDNVRLGSIYRVGSAKLQVAQPRLPCSKLGIFIGDARFPNRFLMSGRLGVYFRVAAAGDFGPGDKFNLVSQADHEMTITKLWRLVFVEKGPASSLEWALGNLPHIDEGWRRRLRQLLD